MSQFVRILLPLFPTNCVVYFKGFISISEQRDYQELIIYITEFTANYEELIPKQLSDDNVVYGYCSEFPLKNKELLVNNVCKNTLILEKRDGFSIKKITVQGKTVEETEDCIIMLYDHKKLRNSETLSNSIDYFSKLQQLLKEGGEFQSNKYEPVLEGPSWLSSSMFGQHVLNYINLMNWLLATIRREKKVSIKLGNLILAILTDIIIGYVVLTMLAKDKKAFSIKLMSVLERLVNMLFSLLKWLMGSPAGLKLNNAFNKMLGKYFTYHIQLWWLFLDVSGEKLDVILKLYNYLGYLGITFQAAIVSDLLCVATFHSYCIYVYAARLFNIQISGLIALLRLFVGRKYNPLRGGIDSCEYTNQELFVGTVAFTILLLLLPTTTMYYIVFTLFRLLSLGVQYILAKLIYIVQTLPLYVMTLWLMYSPKVAGDILLQIEHNEEGVPLVLRVKLFNKSLTELVNKCKPPVEPPKHIEWNNVLSNVFRGKQII